MLGFDPIIFALICAVFFLGGAIKGVLGFGLPLITMSLLPFVVGIETSIALSALVQPATNVGQLFQSGGIKKAFKDTLPVLLMLAPGTAMGAWYLSSLDSNVIILFVGVMVVVFAVYNLTGLRLTISKSLEWPVGIVNGFVAGIVGGITSVNGMFFIMYLVGIQQDRPSFRSSLALLFMTSGVLISSGLWAVGFVNSYIFAMAVIVLVPAFTGMIVGNAIGKRVSNEKFRLMVLIGLLVIGFIFIVRSLNGV